MKHFSILHILPRGVRLPGRVRVGLHTLGVVSATLVMAGNVGAQALKDPLVPAAHARLAPSLTHTSANDERYERAKREADRALTLLPGLAEVRVALEGCCRLLRTA